MELRNTLKNMFLNSLQADLLGIIEKLDDFDASWLKFTKEQTKTLETFLKHTKEWNAILTTLKEA